MNAKEILNKIKWDKSEEPDRCSVFYIDRISNKLEKNRIQGYKKY